MQHSATPARSFVLAVVPSPRAAQAVRPTHHHATGLPLIDLSHAPSSMEQFMANPALRGRG